MENLYKDDSIKSITPREFTRLRPGTYCGSTEYSTQLVKEIFANALDEHNIGHGNKIEIFIDTDKNLYTIIDQGQGFPVNVKREDGATVIEAAYSIMNTSGKYDEDGVYGASALGLNGIGGKLTNFLSKEFQVSSTTGNGVAESLFFKDGILEDRKILKNLEKGVSGTTIHFIPDEQFFKHPEADLSELRKLFKEISALCPKLTIELTVDGKKEVFHSKNGLNDLIDDKVKGKEVLKNRFVTHLETKDSMLDICLTYTSNYSDDITAYVNYGLTDSGVHITSLRSNLTRTFNKFASEYNLLKKEGNLKGEELAEGLVVVFNLKAPGVEYDSQTKTRVTSIDRNLITRAINEEFFNWLCLNKKQGEMIVEKALMARKAKEAAKRARERVRKPQKGNSLKAKMALSDKLIDCTTKDPKNNSLLIVEGLSAGSCAVEARDPKKQAIMMIRGKCISVLKSTKEKVLANREYNDIITAIGAGFDQDFDIKKMNYDKIVITSDFDSDGQAIELLLITFFFTYMKPLVEQGKLYRAVTPLYIATYRGKETFLYTEEELESYYEEHQGEKVEVSHIKGLGELNAEMLKKVCFDNELYKRINVSDVKAAENLLQVLMGKDVKPRKQYIYDNATRIGFDF